MKFSYVLALSCAFIDPTLAKKDKYDDLVKTYSKQGICFDYFDGLDWPNKGLKPCFEYCKKENPASGYTECDSTSLAGLNLKQEAKNPWKWSELGIHEDEQGGRFALAKCKCSNPTVEALVDVITQVVAAGLNKLGNVLCAIGLSTIKTTVDLALMVVPGGQSAAGANAAVRSAKTFAENGLSGQDYSSWIGNICGIPDWNFDGFNALISAPDNVGKSDGCLRKNKAACKAAPKGSPLPKVPQKPDNNKPGNKPNKPSDPAKPSQQKPTEKKLTQKPTSKNQPTTLTKSTKSKTTESTSSKTSSCASISTCSSSTCSWTSTCTSTSSSSTVSTSMKISLHRPIPTAH